MDPEPNRSAAFDALKAGLDMRAAGRIIVAVEDAFPTGFTDLDRALGGGFPRGALSTLEGRASSGRTAILARTLASATAGGLAAVVDDGTLYPPDLERAGVRLAQMLVVSARTPVEIARCTDIVLRSRAFAVVAMPAAALRATVWSRLCGLAQKAGAVVVALGMHPGSELAYFASARVTCAIDKVVWAEQSGVFCELAGYELYARVLKHRRAVPGATARVRIGMQRNGRSACLAR